MPTPISLSPFGPVLVIRVGVGAACARAVKQAGIGAESSEIISAAALIDSGSTFTSIDGKILEQGLRLSPQKQATQSTVAGGKPRRIGLYRVCLTLPIPGGKPLVIEELLVGPLDAAQYGIEALIGQDVLSRCVFTYDGPAGRFTLSAPDA